MGMGAMSAQAQSAKATRITVDAGIDLEVLDWGGPGRPVVLLAGNGQTAHSFDGFAPMLAQYYHVYAITRRGYAGSTPTTTGLVAQRLADDVLAVIDTLRLTRPVVAGHSRAGQELSSIGGRHPERVAGLIYLDAGYSYAFYDSTRGDYAIDVAELRQHLDRLHDAGSRGQLKAMDSLFTTLVGRDLPSLQRDLKEMQAALANFREGQSLLPPRKAGVSQAADDGLQRHTVVHGPVLALYAGGNLPPTVGRNPSAIAAWVKVDSGPVGRFARGVPQAHIAVIPGSTHFLFDSNPRDVLREMRAFIDGLPTR